MVTVDLYRAEDLPEMDSASVGSKLKDIGDKFGSFFQKKASGPEADVSDRVRVRAEPAVQGDGACDPYATLRIDGQEATSAYISGTTAPVWNCRLCCPLSVPTLSTHLVIDVYDHDDMSRDDHCATARIPLAATPPTLRCVAAAPPTLRCVAGGG
eukprot:gene54291-19201_t